MKPQFIAGENIAIKVPAHEFESTVAFYKDILGFEKKETLTTDNLESVTFNFGNKKLWIDKVAGISQAEIWLEIVTENIEAASDYFKKNSCVRRDEIEPLPAGFRGFWISSPSNIIHLVIEEST